MRWDFTPIRRAVTKKEKNKTENKKHWLGDGGGETATLIHCWWECKMVQLLLKTDWQSLKKIKHRITIWSSNSTSGYISKRTESMDSNRYLHTTVHSSVTHNSQKTETTQISMTRTCVNNTWQPHDGVLFNLEKRSSETCYMYEPWKHYTVK